MKLAHKHIEICNGDRPTEMETKSNGHGKPSDLQLWQEFKSGNETAFATMYNENAGRLFSYGIKLVHEQDSVKDGIQDLFVELWNNKERLGEVKSIKSYLYRSLRRKLISQASERRKKLSFFHCFEGLEETVSSQEINLIEKQNFDEQRLKLKRAMGMLNAKQQEIIHLKFYGLLSYDEIAEIMSIDKKGAYNSIAYALKLLRQHLGVLLTALVFHLI